MSEPILDPDYWRKRLTKAPIGELHRSIFITDKENWKAIEENHKRILFDLISPSDSVLDVGCAWGRLLELMPRKWSGDYLGIDISPDFINHANSWHIERKFLEGDIRDIEELAPNAHYDWSILISIRPMVIRNLGNSVWEEMEKVLKRVSSRILFLEYDVNHKPEIIAGDSYESR